MMVDAWAMYGGVPLQTPRVFRATILAAVVCVNCSIGTHAAPPPPTDHPVLSPTEALQTFRLPEGFEIRLVASEPDLVNPVTMTLDELGRVYVSLAHTYRYGPEGAPVNPPSNPVVRLDLGTDGRVARRTVVASAFDDPVMGLAVRDSRLWATNLNRVFLSRIDSHGRAAGQETIVQDAETPSNPFGMYRLAFGPDGLLYLSVGDHPIKLSGSNNSVTVRGNTGGVFRFQPDGSDIELLVQGMRAPFSFDFDPYGRLWVLSNGEGNPNRLIHAILGADYHFQTRSADWSWLAGKHPLAPPVWENPPGAHTAVLAYYSSAFPAEYWGNLLVSNWGVHGFPSANHVILRHVLDERGNLIDSEPFLTTTDPRFRPTQIALAPDGNLYVLDWYGRDDENDLTGRLYKIAFVGSRPAPSGAALPRPDEQPAEELDGLASRHHGTRQQTRRRLLSIGPTSVETLAGYVSGPDALAASEALCTLRQSGWPNAGSVMQAGLQHANWRVRRLAVRFLREMGAGSARLERLIDDPDPAVQLEAAISLTAKVDRLHGVAQVIRRGAAASPRLRYRAALEVARLGDSTDFETLLTDNDADIRLTGLIALDEAFHEGVRAEAALEALVKRISVPGDAPLSELLTIARRWPHASVEEPVATMLNRDLPAEDLMRGIAVLHQLPLPPGHDGWDHALERFLNRVATGDVALRTHGEKLGTLDILAAVRPGPDMVVVLNRLLRDEQLDVRAAAHRVLASIGVGNRACIELCWTLIGNNAAALEHRLEAIVSLSQIEKQAAVQAWTNLLESPSRKVALVALRCLRNHTDRVAIDQLLTSAESRLTARGAAFNAVLKSRDSVSISPDSQQIPIGPHTPEEDPATDRRKEELRARLLKQREKGDPLLGRLVFRSEVCHRCHEIGGHAALSGPSLDGAAAANPIEYLVDSILYPSKVIKTGYMREIVVTQQGRILVGGVARQGDDLIVTSASGTMDRIRLKDVDERHRLNQSPMPHSIELTMSEPELLDLVAYLATLRQDLDHETKDSHVENSKSSFDF